MTKTAYTATARGIPAALGRGLAGLVAHLAAAERAAAQRSALRELPDYLLRDIGLEQGRL